MKSWNEIFVQWWFWPSVFLYSAGSMINFVLKWGGIGLGSAIGTVFGCFIVVTILATVYYWIKR